MVIIKEAALRIKENLKNKSHTIIIITNNENQTKSIIMAILILGLSTKLIIVTTKMKITTNIKPKNIKEISIKIRGIVITSKEIITTKVIKQTNEIKEEKTIISITKIKTVIKKIQKIIVKIIRINITP
jgi:hypothetical protein